MSTADERYRLRVIRHTDSMLSKALIKATAMREQLRASLADLEELEAKLDRATIEPGSVEAAMDAHAQHPDMSVAYDDCPVCQAIQRRLDRARFE